MASFTFIDCMAPYTFENSDTLYKMIDFFLKLGHSVAGVFFYIDGEISLNKKMVIEEGVRSLPEKLQAVAQKGIPVVACSACADYRRLRKEDVAEEGKLVGLMTLADYLLKSDKVIVFGL